ncbi:MAG: sulfotransferase [Leptospirillia bacterium]
MAEHFFIVGAQRCGTTFLYRLLAGHPEIEMAEPVRPEPKFFLDDERYEKGLDDYEQRFFSGKPGAWLKGEKSTSYLESDIAAKRISEAFPDARIIVLLRDPVARAVSNWRFSVQHGVETLSMAEAFMQEEKRREDYDRSRFSVSPYAYLARGCYVDYIATFERYFPRRQIGVFLFEELTSDPAAAAAVFTFLGVDSTAVSGVSDGPVNASDEPEDASGSPNPDLVRYLADYFAAPNARLAAWLGRPLDAWTHPEGAG